MATTITENYKIISGGGQLIDGDIVMVETYPLDRYTWVTKMREHVQPTVGNTASFAIAIYDPDDEWDVQYFSEESDSSDEPWATVSIPDGYLLTGGGARISSADSGAGVVLFSSYPSSNNTWKAVAHQHISPGTGKVTAYAIGVRHKSLCTLPNCHWESEMSSANQHVSVSVATTAEVIVGGGAMGTLPTDASRLAGNMLFISSPFLEITSGAAVLYDGESWEVKAQDHKIVQYGTVTSYTMQCSTDEAQYL